MSPFEMTKARPIIEDPDARSAEAGKPEFLAQPPGSPAYYGFLVIEDSETEGWRYGAITAYENVGQEDAGDGFVITPDGACAGIVWSLDGPEFEMIVPPDERRWGVFELRFPKPVSSKKDLIENFRAILPRLKAEYERVRKKG